MGGFSRKRLWIGGALIALLLLVAGAFFALSTWGDVNRVTIDRSMAPGVVAAGESNAGGDDPPEEVDGVNIPSSGDGLDVFLIVGSDSRADLESLEGFGDFGGQRADVVMVLIRPRNGSKAALLSLPRDLLVDDICGPGEHKLNDALAGCGAHVNGPTALLLTVEDLIGLPVDHFALVDLAGFQDAVDRLGGYEICVDRPVRDSRAGLSLPAGCTLASGKQTLAWMRSRSTQELTESGWRTMPGVNDLTRNERQREFLIHMMSRLSDFSSPQDVASVARAVAPYVTVDADLAFMDAVGLAWTMRGMGTDSVKSLEVPVVDEMTKAGAAVLVPTVDIADLVDSFLNPTTTSGRFATSFSR